jgi:hypothetical protein
MPWDSSGALDRLGTSVRGLADLRRRKKEANSALLMELLGKGTDIWKTATQPGRDEAAAKVKWGASGSGVMELGAKTDQELKLMEASHGYELDTIQKNTVSQTTLEILRQSGKLEELRKEYFYRLLEAHDQQNWQDSQRIATEDFTKKLKDAEIASSEKMPGLQAAAGVQEAVGRVQGLAKSGLTPMESLYGYKPGSYGAQPSDTFKLYRDAIDRGLDTAVKTLPGTVGEFLTTDVNTGQVIENWTKVPEMDKQRILAGIEAELQASGLAKTDPLWQTYMDIARNHMSLDQYRDNEGEAAKVKIDITQSGGGAGGATTGGTDVGLPGAAAEAVKTITGGAPYTKIRGAVTGGGKAGSGQLGKAVIDTVLDGAKWFISGLTGGAVDLRAQRPTTPPVSGVNVEEQDVYNVLDALKKLASAADASEINTAMDALATAPDDQVDMQKILDLIKRVQNGLSKGLLK